MSNNKPFRVSDKVRARMDDGDYNHGNHKRFEMMQRLQKKLLAKHPDRIVRPMVKAEISEQIRNFPNGGEGGD